MTELSMINERLKNIEKMLLSQKTVFTLKEACVFSGISRSFMYKLTHKGLIEHFKPRGKQIYFQRESLEKWLLQNPIKTASQIEAEANSYLTLNNRGVGK